MEQDQDTTIPSRLMARDFSDAKKKPSADGHPIFKILLGGLGLIAFLLVWKSLRA